MLNFSINQFMNIKRLLSMKLDISPFLYFHGAIILPSNYQIH